MKKTAATAKMPKKPSRPTTPAPAAFWLTASALLFSASKKPEESTFLGSLICASFGLLLHVGHSFDVGGVVLQGVLHRDAQHGADGECRGRSSQHAAPARRSRGQ